MKKENWKIGRQGTVVTDSEEGFRDNTGHYGKEAKEYYTWREKDARLIASAPKLLEALKIYLNAGSKEQRKEASVIAKKVINEIEKP